MMSLTQPMAWLTTISLSSKMISTRWWEWKEIRRRSSGTTSTHSRKRKRSADWNISSSSLQATSIKMFKIERECTWLVDSTIELVLSSSPSGAWTLTTNFRLEVLSLIKKQMQLEPQKTKQLTTQTLTWMKLIHSFNLQTLTRSMLVVTDGKMQRSKIQTRQARLCSRWMIKVQYYSSTCSVAGTSTSMILAEVSITMRTTEKL